MVWGGAALFILARGWEGGSGRHMGDRKAVHLLQYSGFLNVVDSWGLLWDGCHLLCQGPWDISGAQ